MEQTARKERLSHTHETQIFRGGERASTRRAESLSLSPCGLLDATDRKPEPLGA